MIFGKNIIYLFKKKEAKPIFNKIDRLNILNSKCSRGIIFSILFLLIFQYNLAYSATVDELKDQIQKVTNTKAQLEKEIAVYEQQLTDLSVQSNSLSNTIKSLNVTINKNSLDIKLTQNNINSTQLQIEELSMNIGKNIDTINQNTKAVALLLNEVNKNENTSFMENLLAYKNLSEFWNEQQSIYQIQNQIREKIAETKNTKAVLESNKIKAENKKADLLKLKSNLIDQKKVLDITKSEKNKLLADTKNSEANYKKMLADKKALAEAFDKELLQFESELKFAIDPNSYPVSRNSMLSWPLDIIKISQKFGVTDFSTKTNIYNGKGHNGIDFATPIGTKVRVVLSGIVEGTGNTDLVCPGASNGKWILIKHDNGLSSIYVHLSVIKVTAGQRVFTGDVIGLSGYSGFVYPPGPAGAHLHLGLFISQGVKIMSYKFKTCKNAYATMPVADLRAYLDPLTYLPSL